MRSNPQGSALWFEGLLRAGQGSVAARQRGRRQRGRRCCPVGGELLAADGAILAAGGALVTVSNFVGDALDAAG
jgi:hypothetical protein